MKKLILSLALLALGVSLFAQKATEFTGTLTYKFSGSMAILSDSIQVYVTSNQIVTHYNKTSAFVGFSVQVLDFATSRFYLVNPELKIALYKERVEKDLAPIADSNAFQYLKDTLVNETQLTVYNRKVKARFGKQMIDEYETVYLLQDYYFSENFSPKKIADNSGVFLIEGRSEIPYKITFRAPYAETYSTVQLTDLQKRDENAVKSLILGVVDFSTLIVEPYSANRLVAYSNTWKEKHN